MKTGTAREYATNARWITSPIQRLRDQSLKPCRSRIPPNVNAAITFSKRELALCVKCGLRIADCDCSIMDRDDCICRAKFADANSFGDTRNLLLRLCRRNLSLRPLQSNLLQRRLRETHASTSYRRRSKAQSAWVFTMGMGNSCAFCIRKPN